MMAFRYSLLPHWFQIRRMAGLSCTCLLALLIPLAAAAQTPGEGGQGSLGFAVTVGLVVLLGVLTLMAIVLLVIIAVVINASRAAENKEPLSAKEVRHSFFNLVKNPFISGVVVLVLVVAGTSYSVTTARGVGLHQNYAPVQPILFSHKIHAGQYGINCQYCHSGAAKGKSATIPAISVCMNCHNYIQEVEGNEEYTRHVKKLLAHYEAGKPVEWVRIHNLPDLAYFNHAQHVTVAGLECQECHGPIQEMEVVYQYSPLSMGWCINCHRQKEVDVTKNDYYLKVHNEYVGKETPVTVEMLGGLECAKCHY